MMQAMWVTHGMIKAMCQAHRKEGDFSCLGGGGNIRLGGEKRKREKKREREERKEKQREERKKKEKEKKMKEKEGEEGRTMHSSSDPWRWALKSVYATRATLQEVRILPTLVYLHLKGLFMSEFWDWLSVGKQRDFLPTFFIEIVSAFVNLILDF